MPESKLKPKTFTQADREKLLKLLEDSQNVGVLKRGNVMARANHLLKTHGVTWNDVLARFRKGGSATDWSRSQNVDRVFETIYLHVYGEPRTFIDSLKSQLERRGSLTEKQWEALRKFYDNVTDTSGGSYYDSTDWEDEEDSEMRDILSDGPF